MKCDCCDTEKEPGGGQWWNLNNYFGLYGLFCAECFELVSHDAYRKPKHPEEYTTIAVKMKIKGM